MTEDSKSKKDPFESTVVTSIEKLEAESEQSAYILFLAGPLQGKLYCLEPGMTVIGRADEADIMVSDARISRRHFEITLEQGVAVIRDLGSTNGTFINGKRVTEHKFVNGDKIQISSNTILKFAYGDAGERMFHEEFYQMANFDAVTGVQNKQSFVKRFQEEFSFAKRNNVPLSLIMCDIDFFKKVNDTFGHIAGDYALREVAQLASSTIRSEDILARYGGEEFAIILRNCALDGAVQLAERIRLKVADRQYKFEEYTFPVTISLGVATLDTSKHNKPEDLLAEADARLYKSKQGGRNRVTAV